LELGLPPLPFPRIVSECSENVTWGIGADNDWQWDLELFMVNERVQGEHWDVCMLLRRAGTEDDPEQHLWLYEVLKDGSCVVHRRGDAHPTLDRFFAAETRAELEAALDELRETDLSKTMITEELASDDAYAIAARTFVIEFAHLINARGVTVEHQSISRSQRRRFERRRIVHPQVYFVFIDDGEIEMHEGRSDREYHCRWLVRGHWRHFQSGNRIWIRPYIKGPAGAPWKGRPIYVLDSAA
jgi:hypothetical protein